MDMDSIQIQIFPAFLPLILNNTKLSLQPIALLCISFQKQTRPKAYLLILVLDANILKSVTTTTILLGNFNWDGMYDKHQSCTIL